MSTIDPAVFRCVQNVSLTGLLLVHVDYVFWSSTQSFERNVVQRIRNKFLISTEKYQTLIYIGVYVEVQANSIKLYQENYVQELKSVNLPYERCKFAGSDITSKEFTLLRHHVG